MYAQKLGWLHATPEKADCSRAESLGVDNDACAIPDCDNFLVSCFHSVGRCLSGGMAVTAITWQELKAFSELSDSNLTAWESEQIINMSKQYCSWLTIGKDPLCSAPWHDDDYDELQIARERVVKNAMKFKGVIDKRPA